MTQSPEQTTDPRSAEYEIILDGVELIRRMARADEPWCQSEVRDWVRRAREALHAIDA